MRRSGSAIRGKETRVLQTSLMSFIQALCESRGSALWRWVYR